MPTPSDLPFTQLLLQQWHQLCRNRWLLGLLTWVPCSLFLLLWWIFSAGITRDLPIAVIDYDHSQLSRQLTRYYEASPTLAVESHLTEPEARKSLRQAQVYALVIIPEGLERETKLGQAPAVTAYYNAQFMLVGKQVNSALQQSHATLNAKVAVVRNLSHGSTPTAQALAAALPIRGQISALYNGNSNYAQFLVSAAMPAFWQVLIMVVMVLAIAGELKEQSLRHWLASQAYAKITAKLLVYGGLLLLHGVLFCNLMFQVFDWPMRGSWSLLLLALLLCLIASQSIALLFVVLFQDKSRALSFAGALTAPNFAFMGISFPVWDMSGFAQFWRTLIPITHYIELQVSQANHGAPPFQSMTPILHLLSFTLVLLCALWLVRTRFGGQTTVEATP